MTRATEAQKGDTKEQVALTSIAASAGITIAKLVAGLLSGSLALISEAAHALVDTAATVVTYLAVRTSNKPPDDEHHYGHGKFESLAALAECVVLFILATVVVIHAWDRLQTGGGQFEPTLLAFAVLIVSIVVDLNRVRILRKTASETGSQALAADAIHFASDLVGSVLVLIGLAASWAGFKQGDALAALGVAGFIAIAGFQLGRRTIDTLVDKAPEGISHNIGRIIAALPGVIEVPSIRLRSGGAHLFGDVSVVVSRTLPLEAVNRLIERITAAVAADHPDLRLTVTTVPKALDDETVLERVLLTAAHNRLPVHHVTVQSVGHKLSVSLDIEVDERMRLGAAHMRASKLEAALREELGPDAEIETHIEPLAVRHIASEPAAPELAQRVVDALKAAAAMTPGVDAIHDVRVRQGEKGLLVNYHCRVATVQSVLDAHVAVDRLDRSLREQFPEIVRVTGHAEPVVVGEK